MEIRVRADNLTEEIRSKADIDSFVIGFMIYGVEGLIMTVTNFPVVFAIAMYKQLREQKEFVIVAGLALADGLYGFGFLIAAFGRIIAIEQGNGFVLVSRWDCSLKIWNIIWLISNPLAGLMLLVISIDRLLAVSIPFRYFTFTSRYAFKLVAAVYTFVMFPALLSTYLSYQFQAPEYPAYCFTSYGMHSYYYR
uniref:G-protein coupled receptors family 1 profile domain-containing protein n=1 Tax=Plectus sambesii TaxID=2011161 RepID=A0A914VI77_9BILA